MKTLIKLLILFPLIANAGNLFDKVKVGMTLSDVRNVCQENMMSQLKPGLLPKGNFVTCLQETDQSGDLSTLLLSYDSTFHITQIKYNLKTSVNGREEVFNAYYNQYKQVYNVTTDLTQKYGTEEIAHKSTVIDDGTIAVTYPNIFQEFVEYREQLRQEYLTQIPQNVWNDLSQRNNAVKEAQNKAQNDAQVKFNIIQKPTIIQNENKNMSYAVFNNNILIMNSYFGFDILFFQSDSDCQQYLSTFIDKISNMVY